MNKQEKSKPRKIVKCILLPVFICLGILAGIVTGNLALFLAIGVAVGVGLISIK